MNEGKACSGPQPKMLLIEKTAGQWRATGTYQFEQTQGYSGGAYSAWLWNGKNLTVSSDPLGLCPVFYVATERRFLLSNSIQELLRAHHPALDDAMVATMLHYGQCLGDRTVFKGVKSLTPNASLSWESGHITQQHGGYRFVPAQNLTRDQAIEGYITLFQEAIAQSLRQSPPYNNWPIVTPLTGGRDSRHILYELCAQKQNIETALTAQHFPIRSNQDMAVAKAICAELGVKHLALDTFGDYPDAEAGKLSELGWLSLEHIFSLPILKYLEKQGGKVRIYDGLGGDVLSAGLYLSKERHKLFEQNKLEELAINLCQNSGIERFLAPSIRQRFDRASALAAIKSELERHYNAVNPVTSFLFWNRTRRNVALAPLALMARRGARIITPFTYLPLFDFLTALPAEMMWDHRFHDDAIERAYPLWRHLPYEDKNRVYQVPSSLTHSCVYYAFKKQWHAKTPMLNSIKIITSLLQSLIYGRKYEAWWFRRLLYLTNLFEFLKSAK